MYTLHLIDNDFHSSYVIILFSTPYVNIIYIKSLNPSTKEKIHYLCRYLNSNFHLNSNLNICINNEFLICPMLYKNLVSNFVLTA